MLMKSLKYSWPNEKGNVYKLFLYRFQKKLPLTFRVQIITIAKLDEDLVSDLRMCKTVARYKVQFRRLRLYQTTTARVITLSCLRCILKSKFEFKSLILTKSKLVQFPLNNEECVLIHMEAGNCKNQRRLYKNIQFFAFVKGISTYVHI